MKKSFFNISVFIWIMLLIISCDGKLKPVPVLTDEGDTPNIPQTTSARYLISPFPEWVENQDVQWERCRLREELYKQDAACAFISVPINWEDQSSPKIQIKIKMLPGSGKVKKQIYLLQGGPGGSSTITLPLLMEIVKKEIKDADVFVIDHRGTGYSSFLKDPKMPENSKSLNIKPFDSEAIQEKKVAKYLASKANKDNPNLKHFNITNAAIDLAAVIKLLRQPEQEVFVYGVSYGTLWVHRYAQMFPEQADGIIMDSIVPSKGITVMTYGDGYDNVIERIAQFSCYKNCWI